MAWNSNLRKGVDIPTWDWLSFNPQGNSNLGTANAYDGTRFMYWVTNSGSTTGSGTTQLWRYDTWSDAWAYLASTTNGSQGMDIEYDPIRNVLWLLTGNSTTEWRVYSLNRTNISVLGQTITPRTLTTITTVLPAAAGTGAALQLIEDITIAEPFDSGTLTSGSTTTVLNDIDQPTFHAGQIGLSIRLTSGAASGQRRIISAVGDGGTSVTVSSAFGTAPAAGDTFVIEYPQGTASSGSSTTLVDSSQTWGTNVYASSDVVITAGTGAGQRRRIASNTSNTLTLAAAVTGNTRTGNWTTAPDNTSVYKIVPSSDFLYYAQASNTTAFYRIDLNTGASATTWATLTSYPAAPNGGHNLMAPQNSAPFCLLAVRGNGTNTIYRYDIGPNTWATLSSTYIGADTFNTGAHSAMIHGKRIIAIQKEGSTRIVGYNLCTGEIEAVGTQPYANPGVLDGKRMRVIKTPNGVQWLYLIRNGANEHFRLAIEWL